MQLFAKELVQLNPDVLVAGKHSRHRRFAAHTIPIVFAHVSDPVGSGFVASLVKPGGNITGFINLEASLSGKWLELLRQIRRVGFLFNPQTAPYARYYLDTFRSAASVLAVEPMEVLVHSTAEVS